MIQNNIVINYYLATNQKSPTIQGNSIAVKRELYIMAFVSHFDDVCGIETIITEVIARLSVRLVSGAGLQLCHF